MARLDMIMVAEYVYKFLLNYAFLMFVIIRLKRTCSTGARVSLVK